MTVDPLRLAPHGRPFAGSRPFGPDDASRFFGRETEISEVAGLWRGRRVTVLSGPSGAGLTSLLNAGLVPRLVREGADILPVGRIADLSPAPKVIPFLTPARRNPLVSSLLSSWSPQVQRAEPSQEPTGAITSFLDARTAERGDPDRPCLAAIDQVEGLFADPANQRHVPGLIGELAQAMEDHPRLHLLLALRDAYPLLIQPLARRLSPPEEPASARIAFLEPAQALEAIHRPLESTDREFAPGAAEFLVDELRTPPGVDRHPAAGDTLIAPALLQVCCARVWSRVPDDVRSITTDHIRAYAGIDRTLVDFVTRVLGETAAQHGISVEALRSWLQCEFSVSRDRARGGFLESPHVDEGVLRTLEDRHLLRSEADPGDGVRYALYHERLAEPLRHVPGSFTAADYLRSAELALAAGEFDLADKHVAETLAAATDDRRLHADTERLRGDIAAERGRPEVAEEHYLSAAALLEALQDTQGVGSLLAAIGRLQLARGLSEPAFEKLRAAAERLPADSGVNISLARVLWSMGQRRAAVDVLTELLAANEDTPDALRTRGEFLADLGEARRALRDLDRVRRNPSPVARAARALALATLDDEAHARDEIDAALAEAPDDGQVLLYAARIAELGGDHATAAERAAQALRASAHPLAEHQREEAERLTNQGRDH